MRQGVLEVDPRHTARRIRTAMQGSTIRALVELITNSDDSYTRLEADGFPSDGVIEIVYRKEGHRCVFAVRDFAEGMSAKELENKFTHYGAATSGMKMGKGVRGYFGQGAKDALAGMCEGRICTFKDKNFAECRLFIKNNKVMWELGDPRPAEFFVQAQYNISGNGTYASFVADPEITGAVPRFAKVQEEIANNYQLRKIMTNRRRKVFLIDDDSGGRRRLRYQMPQGVEALSEKFIVSHEGFGEFPISLVVTRANQELPQSGDDRAGGLLLLDDQGIVLGISLFKYDNEPLAARLFGELTISGFRKLLEKEEPVLSEEREGLVTRHPFCRTLIAEVEKRVEALVDKERQRRRKEELGRFDKEEASRFRSAFRILNEIAEVEAPDAINLGDLKTEELEAPLDGLSLHPSSAQITVGKRYNFQLRIDTSVVPREAGIRIETTHPKIRLLTKDIKVEANVSERVISKFVTIEGTEPSVEGVLRASYEKKVVESKVYVMAEKELLLTEGMVFQPESVTVRPNQPKTVHLVVYLKMIESGSIVKLSSENPAIQLSRNSIVVNAADGVRHFAKYEVEVWGEGEGQSSMITAEFESYTALLEVSVKSKSEEGAKGRKGMFDEPEFSQEPDPNQRTSYSRENGRVVIYVNFPSVRAYLGESCQFKKTLPAQVLVADLVAERCFHEIARRKVETSAAMIRPEGIPDRILRDAAVLSRRYGEKVHKALVNQDMLDDAKKQLAEQRETRS